MPEFASLTAEMLAMTSHNRFKWLDKHTILFEKLKQAFLNAQPHKQLVVNEETKTYDQLILSIDFSSTAVAAVLGQIQGTTNSKTLGFRHSGNLVPWPRNVEHLSKARSAVYRRWLGVNVNYEQRSVCHRPQFRSGTRSPT